MSRVYIVTKFRSINARYLSKLLNFIDVNETVPVRFKKALTFTLEFLFSILFSFVERSERFSREFAVVVVVVIDNLVVFDRRDEEGTRRRERSWSV